MKVFHIRLAAVLLMVFAVVAAAGTGTWRQDIAKRQKMTFLRAY